MLFQLQRQGRTCSPIETKAVVTLYCIAFGADTKRYQGYVHTRKDGFYASTKIISDRTNLTCRHEKLLCIV